MKKTAVLPRLDEVITDLRGIEALLADVEDDYWQLDDLARKALPGARRTRPEEAKIRAVGTNNPTEASALMAVEHDNERGYLERKARRMAKLIGQARARLLEAHAIGDEVFDRTEKTAAGTERGDMEIGFVSEAEVRESERAKVRRRARGEL